MLRALTLPAGCIARRRPAPRQNSKQRSRPRRNLSSAVAHRSTLARSEPLAHVEGEVRVLIRTGISLHNGCAVSRVHDLLLAVPLLLRRAIARAADVLSIARADRDERMSA